MVFQDSTNLNNVTKYIVDANGDTPYTTIQSAITAAAIPGGFATIYVREGTYVEDLLFSPNITIRGTSATESIIQGVHTPPSSGILEFNNLTLNSPTDILNSALVAATEINIKNSFINVTNGYVFNILNWTGDLSISNCRQSSTNDGVVFNAGGSDVNFFNSDIGNGTGQTMTLTNGGIVNFESCNVSCPVSIGGTKTGTITMGSRFQETLTTAGTATVSIDDTIFTTGANVSISHGSGNALSLSNVTIDSTNATPIGGTGTINYGTIDFLNNTTVASTLTMQLQPVLNTAINGWNGSIIENTLIDVSSDGATITFSIQRDPVGDLTVITSKGFFDWDTTPADTITLTAGTDTSPTLNYVFWLESTRVLSTNTTGFLATEHVPLATVLCQSAASLQTDGAYKVHAWTDHITATSDQGHVGEINRWIREQDATWVSGVAPTLTITPQGGAADNVIFTSTIGTILQLHEHGFPVQTGIPDVYTVNDFTTPYNVVTDLNALLTDSQNVSMSGRYFSLVIWGVVSEDINDSKLMVNLPSGSYNTEAALLADDSKFTTFSIPTDFRGTGFLIAQLNLRHQVAASGTWTEISTVDLRGTFPSTAAGGTVPAGTEFLDSVFRILDNADPTKEISFQAAGISAGVTRSMTVPDASGTIALTSNFSTALPLGNTTANTVESTAITSDPGAASDAYLQFSESAAPKFRMGNDETDDTFRLSVGSALGTNDTFIMDTSGIRRMPLQPAFGSYLNANSLNVTGDGTDAIIGVVTALTQIFDQNGDFNTNGTFTAPVTGSYYFNMSAGLLQITAAHTQTELNIVTSNRTYFSITIDSFPILPAAGDVRLDTSCFADMDAADTATARVKVSNSTKTIDIVGGGNAGTRWGGFLVV